MTKSLVEQSDLEAGYTYIETTIMLAGTSPDKVVAIRGGKHPKMRLLLKESSALLAINAGPSGPYSYVYATAFTTDGCILEVSHMDGDIAGVSIESTAAGDIQPVIESTAGADVFDADEDVLVRSSTAMNTASIALIVLKFEVVN